MNTDSICKDITIVTEENLKVFLEEGSTYYDTQISLIEQGINIFDINNSFFTDICFDFDNPVKKDIILSDRIKYFFRNVSLCNDGCEYKGINLENMTATCNCLFNDILNNELIKENDLISDSIEDNLDLTYSNNFLVFKCFKYALKHFTSSIGCWITLILSLVQFVMVLLYFYMDLPKIKIYINSLTERYLSFLNISKDENTNSPPIKKVKFKKKKSRKKIIEENNLRTIDNNITHENKLNKNRNVFDIKNSENKKVISFSNRKELILTPNGKGIDLSSLKENFAEKEKEFFKEYFSTSPDDMEYDDAIFYDKRKFCEYFAQTLKEKQFFANTFFAHDDLNPRTIKIIFFVFYSNFEFVINGLLLSESSISDLFEVNEEEEHFSSFLKRSSRAIIFEILAIIALGIILDFILIEEKKLKGILKREKKDKNILKQKIKLFIKDIHKRYIAFIIFSSIILLFSFFYLLCFNYVYQYSQIEWIKSSITIIISMPLAGILGLFLVTSLRFLSFKCRSEKLYKISKNLYNN